MNSHNSAARIPSADPVASADIHPNRSTSTGTSDVDTTPPRFPAVFMIPPAAPAWDPEMSVALDQNGPSVAIRNPTPRESAATAGTGCPVRAPHKISDAETSRPLITTTRRPGVRPNRVD